MLKVPNPVHLIIKHRPSQRCIKVKTLISVLIIASFITGHWFVGLTGNLLWVWADPD